MDRHSTIAAVVILTNRLTANFPGAKAGHEFALHPCPRGARRCPGRPFSGAKGEYAFTEDEIFNTVVAVSERIVSRWGKNGTSQSESAAGKRASVEING